MDANRDEATRCLEMAEAALSLHEFDRAERLVAKSERMFPLPAQDETRARILTLRKTRPAGAEAPKKRKGATPEPEPAAPAATADMVELVNATRAAAARGPYAVLGVPRDASDGAIKRAYRRLVLRLHPDKNFAPGAEDAFKAVARAFETLSDPRRREAFDRTGVDPDDEQASMPTRRHAGHRRPHFRRRARRGFSDDDFQFVFEQFHHDFDGDHVFMHRAYNRDAGTEAQPFGSLTGVFLVFAILFVFSLFSSILNSVLLFIENFVAR